MILSVEAFKELYDIELDDVKVQNAIMSATEYFYNLITKRHEFKLGQFATPQIINTVNFYPISRDLSLELKAEDVDFFEYDADYNVTDLRDQIVSFQFIEIKNENRVKMTLTQDLPLVGGEMMILRIPITRLNIFDPQKIDLIRRFLALKTFNMMSNDIIMSLSQNGITSWNLNGVAVDTDKDGIKSIADNNEIKMKDLYNKFMPMAIQALRTPQIWLGGSSYSKLSKSWGYRR